MNTMPIDVRRRMMFVDDLRSMKEMDVCEIEYLKEAARKGSDSFLEALCHVCGRETSAYIRRIAESCFGRAELILDQMEERRMQAEIDQQWEDCLWLMMGCYMVSTCAAEMAKCIDQELHWAVMLHHGRMKACCAKAFDINLDMLQQWKERLN